jgi:hypothetical protein
MAQSDPETLERELLTDLRDVALHGFGDDEFSGDVYRALTNTVWRKPDGPEGHVSFSFKRAEEVVNELRAEQRQPPLTLAQTGGEGEVSPAVEQELGSAGWAHGPLDTRSHDDAHLERPGSPPPAGQGGAQAPADGYGTLTSDARHSGEVGGGGGGRSR